MSDISVPETVFVVDDEPKVIDSLAFLLRTFGWRVETFLSASDFLSQVSPDRAGCVLLDYQMPGMTGLDLQTRMAELGYRLPIVFLTGHADVEKAVQAMKHGALDFIEKPYKEATLSVKVETALAKDRTIREDLARIAEVRRRIARLTAREREVFALVVQGLANREVAENLDVSARTVEIHRARVMRKMEAENFADLVRMAMMVEDAVEPVGQM